MSKQQARRAAHGGGQSRGGGAGKLFYIIIAVVIVLGGGWLLMASVGPESEPPPMSLTATEVEADAGVGIAEGPANAPATLVEFADYQCPHCARFNGFAGKLLRQNYVDGKGLLRWVVYEFPLDHFQNAIPAAIAARCAGDQGRFWEMRNLLFAHQQAWATERSPNRKFEDYAGQLGLDKGAFADCVDQRLHLSEIMAAKKYGESLGVSSTPTLFFNGKPLTVNPTYENLEALILEAAAATGEGPAPDAE